MVFKMVIDKIGVFLKRAFSCFSLITLVMAVIGKFLQADNVNKYISADQLLTFFVFACLFSLSFLIADFAKNNVIIKRTIQFVLSYLSLALVFLFGGAFTNYVETNGVQNPAFSIVSISFMFVMIYVVCALIVLLAKYIYGKIVNSNKEYKNMFDNEE